MTDTKNKYKQIEKRLAQLESELDAHKVRDYTPNPIEIGTLVHKALDNFTSQVRPTINRLAKEAVMLQLGLTPTSNSFTLNDDAPLHGSRWTDSDERRLLGAFNSWVRAQSVNLGRTESGIIIRLLRTLKHERPIDWQVAGR